MKTVRRYTSDGVTTRYNVNFLLGYLDKDHVYIYTGSDVEYYNQIRYIWVSDTEIELTEPSDYPTGIQITIRRVVPRDKLYVNFNNGAGLKDNSLDNGNLQALMLFEEYADGFILLDEGWTAFSILDMQGFKIINLGDGSDPQDAVTIKMMQEYLYVPQEILDQMQILHDETEYYKDEVLEVDNNFKSMNFEIVQIPEEETPYVYWNPVTNTMWYYLHRGARGPQGAPGATGAQGAVGLAPDHIWNGSELTFRRPDGEWGEPEDLQGPQGEPGGQGAVGDKGPLGDSPMSLSFGNMLLRADGMLTIDYVGELDGTNMYIDNNGVMFIDAP